MPGEFTIKITLDNAAFEPEPHEEIARIVRVIANRMVNDRPSLEDTEFVLMDLNGNSVGEASCMWRSHEEEALDG